MMSSKWAPRLTPEQVKLAVPNYYWWHTIDLGNGIVTPGQKSAELMEIEINGAFEGIDFTGKRVLDAGCWNGGFSVEAARRGAREVVGLDHDRPAIRHLKCSETFRLVADATGLPLKPIDVDLDAPRLSLDHLGKFDIVLFLGVFYHLRDPIAATRELAAIANEVLAIETHIEDGLGDEPAMRFFPGAELANDASNWWGPNKACMVELLKMVGFGRVESRIPKSHPSLASRGAFVGFR
jgi:tRNA (mo5U34)-methyltransferase